MSTPLPTSEQAIAYAESLRTAHDCYADRCSIRLLDELVALRARLAEVEAERNQLEKDRVNYDLLDERNSLLAEVERLTKDRDDWKAKHWKAHDDFHRQFLEMENLRQQVASATVMRGMDAQANCRDEAGHYEEPK